MRKKKAPGQEENESETLRESESWLRRIMENTSDGINISEYDPQTHRRWLVLCNDRYVEMSGRSREELMETENLDQFTRMNPANGQMFHESISKMLPSKGTSTWLRPDGGEIIYEWTAVPIKVGDKYHIIGIDRDVTEQRRVEEALRASELQYQTTLNSMRDAIHVIDKDLRIVLCNPALEQWCRKLDLEIDPVGMTVFEAFPLLPEEIRNEFHHVFQTGETLVREETTIIGDEEFNTETRKIPILDKGKVVQIITVIRDISDRKRAEEALQASEVQYRTTLNSMRDAIHVIDKDLRIVLCNPALEQWCRKLGLESKLAGLTIFEAFPFLSEEVRDEYHHVFQTGKAVVREETNTFGNEEFKVEARKIPILDKGKVVQVVTVLRDITERKKSEDRIRRLAMIAEQAVEGIGMADLDGILQFVNPSWARMHGYETGEELVGEHISVFHTSEQMKTYVNQFNEKVKRTGRHMGESEQMRKDGTTFPSEMAITLFKDEEGEPVGMLAFAVDITDRKKAEEALRESEHDLRMRVRELNCLHNITEVVNKCNDSLDDLIKGIVDVLP
ncbi:MAG: PAS domain S-box protein, partial [Phycisphaerae bacterium]|nr:PAS domain S-box protein [Phycisphaerae bacterium]